jgi:hypothetical protein
MAEDDEEAREDAVALFSKAVDEEFARNEKEMATKNWIDLVASGVGSPVIRFGEA